MDKAGCIEDNDVGALTTEQQSKLNEFKVISLFYYSILLFGDHILVTLFCIQNKKPTTSYIQHYLQAKHNYTTKMIPQRAIADYHGVTTSKT